MVILDDLKTYLGPSDASQWSDPELNSVLAAETAAQARRVRFAVDLFPDLKEALMRRCARNLAMRKMPLGIAMGGEGGDEATRLGGRDPEVRRLEAPYRKVSVG